MTVAYPYRRACRHVYKIDREALRCGKYGRLWSRLRRHCTRVHWLSTSLAAGLTTRLTTCGSGAGMSRPSKGLHSRRGALPGRQSLPRRTGAMLILVPAGSLKQSPQSRLVGLQILGHPAGGAAHVCEKPAKRLHSGRRVSCPRVLHRGQHRFRRLTWGNTSCID